jgi:hypothetical protein
MGTTYSSEEQTKNTSNEKLQLVYMEYPPLVPPDFIFDFFNRKKDNIEKNEKK